VPSYFRLAYSANEIDKRCQEMGREITPWAEATIAETGKQILALCILRGGVFFFTDLLRQVPTSLEPGFCRAQSYSSTDNSQGAELKILIKPEGVSGRRVLLVDDICDSGATLQQMRQCCLDEGATEVRAAVLIHRIHHQQVHTPEFVGFNHPGEEWFAGCGMEDKNFRANYPDIYFVGG